MKNSDAKTYFTGNVGSIELDGKILHYAGWDRPGLHNFKLKTSNLGVQLEPPNTPYADNFHFVELEIIAPELQIVDPVNDAPQWTYNVRFAKDNRSVSERFAYKGSDLQPDYTPPGNTIGRYIYNMNLVARSRLFGQNIAVGYTQIGQVKFDLNQNRVYHNFWFKVPAQSYASKPGPITKHTLNISPV